MDSEKRYALVERCQPREVAPYLPGNFTVSGTVRGGVLIEGEDSCGWTLDDYVIPRLASGLYAARELDLDDLAELMPELVAEEVSA